MTKFERSQAAHIRLCDKHLAAGTTRNDNLYNYHAECFNEQRRLGRRLTKKERRTLFNFWSRFK